MLRRKEVGATSGELQRLVGMSDVTETPTVKVSKVHVNTVQYVGRGSRLTGEVWCDYIVRVIAVCSSLKAFA